MTTCWMIMNPINSENEGDGVLTSVVTNMHVLLRSFYHFGR